MYLFVLGLIKKISGFKSLKSVFASYDKLQIIAIGSLYDRINRANYKRLYH